MVKRRTQVSLISTLVLAQWASQSVAAMSPWLSQTNYAVREMQQNIAKLGKTGAKPYSHPAKKALDHIGSLSIIIVDPPRAGLHEDVIARLLETTPPRIIYLSCNPVTQARDVARLVENTAFRHHQGYNFFPVHPI